MDQQDVGGDGGEWGGQKMGGGLSGERERRWNRETDKFIVCVTLWGYHLFSLENYNLLSVSYVRPQRYLTS